MRILALLIPAVFIGACSQPSEEKQLVQSFREAIQAKDADALGHLTVNPPSIILYALDLTGDDGNLDNKHSITISTPPNFRR